jgi:hypothetical protein
MHYMIVNRTRAGLSAADYERLAELARAFYADIPPGMRILGDWSATDGSCSFALVEVVDATQLEQVQAPFRPYVEMEAVAVSGVSGWQATAS